MEKIIEKINTELKGFQLVEAKLGPTAPIGQFSMVLVLSNGKTQREVQVTKLENGDVTIA
jgi:hypothetical protein